MLIPQPIVFITLFAASLNFAQSIIFDPEKPRSVSDLTRPDATYARAAQHLERGSLHPSAEKELQVAKEATQRLLKLSALPEPRAASFRDPRAGDVLVVGWDLGSQNGSVILEDTPYRIQYNFALSGCRLPGPAEFKTKVNNLLNGKNWNADIDKILIATTRTDDNKIAFSATFGNHLPSPFFGMYVYGISDSEKCYVAVSAQPNHVLTQGKA